MRAAERASEFNIEGLPAVRPQMLIAESKDRIRKTALRALELIDPGVVCFSRCAPVNVDRGLTAVKRLRLLVEC
jgi:hypothetical protein